MAGKGGGAWKVAYADFVTAMMAFFMVMWLTSQNEDVKEAIAHHFEDPFSFYEPNENATSHKPRPGPPSHVALPKQKDAKDGRRSRRPTLMTLGDGNQTTTGTIVFFAPHSAELDAAAHSRLDDLLPSILGKPQKIEIRGHASRRPLPAESPFKDPWQLSYARCLATMQYLEQHGIAPERMRLSQAGVYEPLGKTSGQEKLAQQERVEVNLLNEMARDSLTGSDNKTPDTLPKDDHATDDHGNVEHGDHGDHSKESQGHDEHSAAKSGEGLGSAKEAKHEPPKANGHEVHAPAMEAHPAAPAGKGHNAAGHTPPQPAAVSKPH
jgi:chemotaxis protein MotB